MLTSMFLVFLILHVLCMLGFTIRREVRTSSLNVAEVQPNAVISRGREHSKNIDDQSTLVQFELPSIFVPFVTLGKNLGAGTNGAVKQVFVKCPGGARQELAMKQMPVGKNKTRQENATREAKVLEKMREYLSFAQESSGEDEDLAPFVLAAVAPAYWTESDVYFTTPAYNAGGLEKVADYDYVAEKFGGVPAKIGFALHTAKGLRAMHEAEWVHYDLKTPNVMVSCDNERKETSIGHCHATVIDFGYSLKKGDDPKGIKGTVEYMSPQVANQEDADPAADVWALAIMIWELLWGYSALPYHTALKSGGSKNYKVYLRKILNERSWIFGRVDKLKCNFEEKQLPKNDCAKIKELLKKMFQYELADRIDVLGVIAVLKELAPAQMALKNHFTSPSVKEVSCLDPEGRFPASVEKPKPNLQLLAATSADATKTYSCCYTGGNFIGKGTHSMVLGTSCPKDRLTFTCDAGKSCEDCWDACCTQKRHTGKIMSYWKCTGSKATAKKTNECKV